MNKEQKQEVIEALKNKFSQYSNFYITDTQKLSVAQITNLRRHCFDKQVEMKVAKNTLIKKALESLDNDKYSGVYDSLHQVTALMFSDSPKEPALIISSFRKSLNGEKPILKAAFLNGDIFVGDNQLSSLTKIKTKNELIGEVIGLLLSPVQRVIGALKNRFESQELAENSAPEGTEPKAEVSGPAEAPATAAGTTTKPEVIKSVADAAKPESKATGPGPVATDAKSEAQPAAQIKAEEAEPPSNPEITESKAGTAGPKPEIPPVAETRADVVEPPSARVEVVEPTGTTEAESESLSVAEIKAPVTEPAPEATKVTSKSPETDQEPGDK